MGSWANSLHVRHADPLAVAEAVRAILLERGYQIDTSQPQPVAAEAAEAISEPREPFAEESDQILDLSDPAYLADQDAAFEEDLENFSENADAEPFASDEEETRGICVYQPCRGWVGILDSGAIDGLAAALSARLSADALQVMVNDSDGWIYGLHRQGVSFDEFDSMGQENETGSEVMSPELLAAIERDDEEEIDRLMEQHLLRYAPRGPIWMPFANPMVPPEITFLRARIAEGRASFWDRLRYRWLWLKFLFQVLTSRLRPGGPPLLGFDVPRSTPLGAAELERHLTRLATLFPDADGHALRRLLKQSRFPAEELLADFLDLLGLPRLYAYLSYAYLEDHGSDELAEAGIVQVVEYRFRHGL